MVLMFHAVRLIAARSIAARPIAVAIVTSITALLLAGCGAGAERSGDGHRAVASFYPLAWVTEQIAGQEWEVTTLTQPGTEPHDLSLSIPQTAELSDADLVVLQRGFQPAVDKTVESDSDAVVVDVRNVIDLLPADGPGADVVDPHFWLDPLLMAEVGDAVAEQLTDLDPDGAASYDANAEELRARMVELDRAYTDGLSSCAIDHVVVSHAAFNYLTRYGLDFEAIAGLAPDAEATAADLARLQELVRTEGVTTVFSERLGSSKASDTLARDTGTVTDVLDPIEGLSDQTVDEDYVSLMEANLAALRKASQCR